MSKIPFEKIRSLVERKKLFEQLLVQQAEILCKGDGESLFHFFPEQILDESVKGRVVSEDPKLSSSVQVIGNFNVGTERYFFVGAMTIQQGVGELSLQSEVYQLQRRASFRLSIKALDTIYFTITEFQKKPAYIAMAMADVSAGGARLFFKEVPPFENFNGTWADPGLQQASVFRGVIRPPSGKNIDVIAHVKHIQEITEDHQTVRYFGVEFSDQSPVLKNRLMALVMDLQRKIVNEDLRANLKK